MGQPPPLINPYPQGQTVCNRLELLHKKMDHLRKALSHCKYPKWAMTRVERRFSQLTGERNNNANTYDTADTKPTSTEAKTKGHIVRPYTQDPCRSIKKTCSEYGIQTHFRGNRTIKDILVTSMNKNPMENKSAAIYWFQCGELECDKEYIGETSRTFGESFKQHLKEPSPIHNHSSTTGHITTQDNFQIIWRRSMALPEQLKKPSTQELTTSHLIENIGKFNLHHIWNRVHSGPTTLKSLMTKKFLDRGKTSKGLHHYR